MDDRFYPTSLAKLLKIILDHYNNSGSIFGISKDLFFVPYKDDAFKIHRYGKVLETPIGVAAGPQTQLAQNIVVSWLTGARYIELKTIQTLDELEVSKPCIDISDEGYNCEWSQELKLEQSYNQYLDAWIIIHILRDKFGWNNHEDPGVIFNMSVGYDYDGIQNLNIQWFLDKMSDSASELQSKLDSIKSLYPEVHKLSISPIISDNVTLSTMHGCPSHEIEKIGEYLITKKKLNTTIKLNPTLLGKEKLHQILDKSGFETVVPDIAFEHDLDYDDALSIINNLQEKSDSLNLHFGVKLTNTLESINNKEVFSNDEKMMYMSGRALHPISINLAKQLQLDLGGKLDISFSGGADAYNVCDIFSCGLTPITVCTDLLKPGGYGRLKQYIVELRKHGISEKSKDVSFEYLNNYVATVNKNEAYSRNHLHDPSIKTNRNLGMFDCIQAPCVDTCPTNQGIPDYLYYTSKGEFEKAAEVISKTNPFPLTTGMVCDHLCQTKCTRINYDGPVLIREVKRFIAERETTIKRNTGISSSNMEAKRIAIIGAGPSGLSCAYFLALAGFKVVVYESKEKPGGMVTGAIPSFRLTHNATNIDIQKIIDMGVQIHYNNPIGKEQFELLKEQNDTIYIGAGAQKSKLLYIDGINTRGVIDPLDFLFNVKLGKDSGIGTNVIIVGGGNTAMDAARTAYRCVGDTGNVTVVYRRTIRQMPADTGEIRAVIDEGIEILELTSPMSILSERGKVKALKCQRVKLGAKDESGRKRPEIIPESEFELAADTIIPAIGQNLDIDFVDTELLKTNEGSYQTMIENVFIGGDSLRGASTAINAIGDGRKAAEEIIIKSGINIEPSVIDVRTKSDYSEIMALKVIRVKPQVVNEISFKDRKNFNLVSSTLGIEEVIAEASRCLLCDELCNICTTVCPNLAFHSFKIDPSTVSYEKVECIDGNVKIFESGNAKVRQNYQILHISDWCNQCGNCTTFCPSSGSPYIEKPHLYLTKEEFTRNKDGFFYELVADSRILYCYINNIEHQLIYTDNILVLESEIYRIEIDNNTFRVHDIVIKEKTNFDVDLIILETLIIVMKGAHTFFIGQIH